jgi:hypothetical protein
MYNCPAKRPSWIDKDRGKTGAGVFVDSQKRSSRSSAAYPALQRGLYRCRVISGFVKVGYSALASNGLMMRTKLTSAPAPRYHDGRSFQHSIRVRKQLVWLVGYRVLRRTQLVKSAHDLGAHCVEAVAREARGSHKIVGVTVYKAHDSLVRSRERGLAE